MEIHFLGGATTVTGSQFLLTTARAKVLVDCGMFQGTPDESVRNRIPFDYDPASLDAVLITHAHLDHCGLLPALVREGYRGRIHATAGTAELAALVLLDSGRLHEEFAKREARWERRHPDKVESDDRRQQARYAAQLELAREGEALNHVGGGEAPGGVAPSGNTASAAPATAAPAAAEPLGITVPLPASGSAATGEHVETQVEPLEPARPSAPEAIASTMRALGREGETPRLVRDLDAPLYTEEDAAAVLPHFRTLEYGNERQVAPGVHATLFDAGHILGSSIIRLRVRDSDGGPERIIVFSGDLGRPGAPILRDPARQSGADYVLIESTYGGREHDPQDEAQRVLAETVRLVAEAKGVLLVPSFAIGRTQDIVWALDRLLDEGKIPMLPLYLDSPMASKATDVYRRHQEYFDEETTKIARTGGSPLDYPRQIVTNDIRQSEAIEQAKRPYMIVASNGMLTGGRIINHLRNLIDDPAATILFVGYQGRGTLGANLQAGAKRVRVNGREMEVRCRIRSISGFSAHADEPQLLDWLSAFAEGRRPGEPGFPRRVFLVHGDPEAQIALEPKVRALGFDAYVPRWHESVTLD
jgi:metallo-beta-lactamase family protein